MLNNKMLHAKIVIIYPIARKKKFYGSEKNMNKTLNTNAQQFKIIKVFTKTRKIMVYINTFYLKSTSAFSYLF